MDEQLDGTHFQGVHAEMFGDEALTGEEPVDTHAAHMIQNQILWLERHGGNRSGHRWVTANQGEAGYVGDKAHSSERWMCVALGTYPITPTLTELECMVQLRCNTLATLGNIASGTIGALSYVKIELLGFGESAILALEKNDLHEGFLMRVPITRQPVRVVHTSLRIWIRTQVTAKKAPVGFLGRRFDRFGRSLLFADEDFLSYHTSSWGSLSNYASQKLSLAVQSGLGPESLVQFPPGFIDDRYSDVYKSLYNNNEVQSSSGDTAAIAVWPDDYPDFTVVGGGRDLTPAIGYSSYVQCRSIQISERHQARTLVSGQLRPNVAVKSAVEQLPAVALQGLLERPRMHMLFHPGLSEEYDDGDDVGVREERALYLLADGTNGIPILGGYDQIISDTIKVSDLGGTLNIWLQCIPYFVDTTFIETLEGLQEAAYAQVWDFKAQLIATEGASSSSIVASLQVEQTLEHLPTSIAPVWPALIQLYWRHVVDKTTRRHPTLKEGALYPVDFGLITPIKLTLPLDGLTLAQRDLPLRLQVAAQAQGVPEPVTSDSGGPIATSDVTGFQIFPSVWSIHGA